MDSGCSHHMTGNKNIFKLLKPENKGKVTFGDDNKGIIKGTRTVSCEGMEINDVFYVEGLKHNLLSISQFCDKGYEVMFKSDECIVRDIEGNKICCGKRNGNVYILDFNVDHPKCLSAVDDEILVWHRRLGHANLHTIKKLQRYNLVDGLPKIKIYKNHVCDACQFGKQRKVSFKSKNIVSTTKPLQLLHMDLFGPTRIRSLAGKHYAYVIVDDYSRYTWVLFLGSKDECFRPRLAARLVRPNGLSVAV